MIRLFVGLSLPGDICDRLASLGGGIPGARWVPAENMHVTLRFVGEVDEGTAHDVADALDEVRAPAFLMSLKGLGSFSTGRSLRSLWAGVEVEAPLLHLQAKVERAVVSAGLPPEGRRYAPHATLARLKGAVPERIARFFHENEPFRAGPVAVDRFTLFQSHLTGEGPIYRAVEDYPLEGAGE